jgi:hypothetical protein
MIAIATGERDDVSSIASVLRANTLTWHLQLPVGGAVQDDIRGDDRHAASAASHRVQSSLWRLLCADDRPSEVPGVLASPAVAATASRSCRRATGCGPRRASATAPLIAFAVLATRIRSDTRIGRLDSSLGTPAV